MLSSSRMSGSEVVLLLFWPEADAGELEVTDDDDEQVTITLSWSASEARLSWWHTSAVTTIVFSSMSSSLESSWNKKTLNFVRKPCGRSKCLNVVKCFVVEWMWLNTSILFIHSLVLFCQTQKWLTEYSKVERIVWDTSLQQRLDD